MASGSRTWRIRPLQPGALRPRRPLSLDRHWKNGQRRRCQSPMRQGSARRSAERQKPTRVDATSHQLRRRSSPGKRQLRQGRGRPKGSRLAAVPGHGYTAANSPQPAIMEVADRRHPEQPRQKVRKRARRRSVPTGRSRRRKVIVAMGLLRPTRRRAAVGECGQEERVRTGRGERRQPRR